MQETRCKVLEIIPIDFEGDCYEMITSIFLWMLWGVTTWNAGIEPKIGALQITTSAQTNHEVEEGGRDNENNQGKGNEEYGGRNEGWGGGNKEQGGGS